jgi:hypothetical protein
MDIAGHHFALEVELTLLALILRVKMSRFVFSVEHSNHDSEEHQDYRLLTLKYVPNGQSWTGL